MQSTRQNECVSMATSAQSLKGTPTRIQDPVHNVHTETHLHSPASLHHILLIMRRKKYSAPNYLILKCFLNVHFILS